MYPKFAEIDGKKYPIDTSYRTALKCFDVINDKSIGDYERALAVIYLLFDFIPDENLDIFLQKAGKFLSCDKADDEVQTQAKDFDHNQDFHYVTASFMSDYKIDLTKEDLHWWLYCDLLQGLTEDCILNRVREIRNFDMTEVKDPKQRAKLIEAKKAVELKVEETEEEKQLREEFEKLMGGE